MAMSPSNERVVVKFLVAALGQGREQARAFSRRLPESVHPNLMAAAQAWLQRSCMDASSQFTNLMGAPDGTAPAPTPITKKRSEWTPEMRARQSKLVKRRMRAKGLLGPKSQAADSK